jgi:hypothetical protein
LPKVADPYEAAVYEHLLVVGRFRPRCTEKHVMGRDQRREALVGDQKGRPGVIGFPRPRMLVVDG